MTQAEQAREWLAGAKSIAVLTGAGISAESGVPVFRGPGGLWRNFRPEDLATPQAFARDPELVWEWYQWRRGLIAKVEPNAGHIALAEMEARSPDFALITQNVDGLHDRAGSKRILKVHGDIWLTRCMGCTYQRMDRSVEFTGVPMCPECGDRLRPGVVWFGEALPRLVWQEAERAVHRCDVFLVAGTSAQVYPAAGLIPLAQAKGAKTIEVNLESTQYSDAVGISLRGPSAELLPAICS